MVKLASMLSRLSPTKILVVGDMLLDSYTIGKARRISPEAPVAIIHVQQEEQRPGGAGNVILNLRSLGAHLVVLGRIGSDPAGQILCQALEKEGIATHGLFVQEGYQTPIKKRVIADNQQVVRIDYENLTPLSPVLEQQMIAALPSLLKEIKIIAISDYGKGCLTPALLAAIIQQARLARIPVITDPKGHDFTKYAGTTVIKPNLTEAYHAAHLPLGAPLEAVVDKILKQTEAQLIMLTRSEAGISLFDAQGRREDFPVQVHQVKDVTGAGDTVLAMLAYALASDLSPAEAAQLCNVAAGLAIEQVGCARITLSDLAYRLFEQNNCHKIFDQEHLFVLKEVLKRKPFNLLVLSNVKTFSYELFQRIKQLAQEGESLVIHMHDAQPNEELIEILASLHEVGFVVRHLDHLKRLCQHVLPLQAYAYDTLQFRPLDMAMHLVVA